MSEWKNSELHNTAPETFDKEACLDAVRKPPRSRIRKIYIGRLVTRCFIFAATVFIAFRWPSQLDVLKGWNFFKHLSVFHLLWGLWVFDMLLQLIPGLLLRKIRQNSKPDKSCLLQETRTGRAGRNPLRMTEKMNLSLRDRLLPGSFPTDSLPPEGRLHPAGMRRPEDPLPTEGHLPPAGI